MSSVTAAPPPGVSSALDLLAAGLGQLRREDPLDLPSRVVGEQIGELFNVLNQVDAEISRRLAVFDRTRGCVAFDADSTAAWLRHQVRLSPNAASEHVRVARQLSELPTASRAFAAGELGFDHARVMTRLLEDVPPEVVREAEPSLVQVARRTDPRKLSELTRHLRHTFAPESVLDDELHNHERRRLHVSELLDGMYHVEGMVEAEVGAGLKTALDALMGPPAADDDRTPAQRRHDALGDLVRQQLNAGELPQVGGQRPHLTLTASVETLAKMPGSPAAYLDWGTPVSAEMLRRIACDCSLTPILVNEQGDPLSVGRTSRTFTPAQRKALALRDRGCVLCGRPPAWCEGHHLVPWIDGGETSVENGALVCNRCHHRLHEGGFRLVRKPDDTWTAVRREVPP